MIPTDSFNHETRELLKYGVSKKKISAAKSEQYHTLNPECVLYFIIADLETLFHHD